MPPSNKISEAPQSVSMLTASASAFLLMAEAADNQPAWALTKLRGLSHKLASASENSEWVVASSNVDFLSPGREPPPIVAAPPVFGAIGIGGAALAELLGEATAMTAGLIGGVPSAAIGGVFTAKALTISLGGVTTAGAPAAGNTAADAGCKFK